MNKNKIEKKKENKKENKENKKGNKGNKENNKDKELELESYVNKLNVLYEDNHIIVVEKFVFVPSQSDKTNDIDMLTIVKKYIKEKYKKPGNVYLGLVHRLDRPTSGIMVFAKTSKAASRLSEQIRNKEFVKKYLAVVDGIVDNCEYVELENYLKKDQRNNVSKVVDKNIKDSKKAILLYKALEVNKKLNLSLIQVKLKTGRHHQIRVQMANIGHSLFADQKYGTRGKNKNLCLFAYYLEFLHPITKQKMIFKTYPDTSLPGFSNFEVLKKLSTGEENEDKNTKV